MVRVLFFGIVADKLGKRHVEVQSGLTVAEIIQKMDCTGFQPLLVAVNQEQIRDMSIIVNDGDEVGLMPPFSGG